MLVTYASYDPRGNGRPARPALPTGYPRHHQRHPGRGVHPVLDLEPPRPGRGARLSGLHSLPCSNLAAPETIGYSFTNGFLSAIPGRISSITYHPNGAVHQVTHANGVVKTWAKDPNSMARPASTQAVKAGNTLWSSGAYVYDGTGSVAKTGTSVFLYDTRQRLVSGVIYGGPTGGGTQKTQTYSYDDFGNVQSIGGTSGRSTPTSSATNRLTGAVAYDAAGNLTSWNDNSYVWDAFSQMLRMTAGDEDWHYLFNAADERIWMFRPSTQTSRWTLRDLDDRVLATYINADGTWSRERQIVYRGGALLATKIDDLDWTYLHLDHLGTPRLITNPSGAQAAFHAYYPFGEEATPFDQDDERMKYTGHERDLASPLGAGDDLDYMHARHYNLWTSRFMATDRAGANPWAPQSWNRYAYGSSSPLTFVDPDGNAPIPSDQLALFGRVLGEDFSNVNVHTGALANRVARLFNAGGVTLGSHVFLSSEGAGAYQSGSAQGMVLVGHELVHVSQYDRAGLRLGGGPNLGARIFIPDYLRQGAIALAGGGPLSTIRNRMAIEREAESLESALLRGLQEGEQIVTVCNKDGTDCQTTVTPYRESGGLPSLFDTSVSDAEYRAVLTMNEMRSFWSFVNPRLYGPGGGPKATFCTAAFFSCGGLDF